MVSYTEILVDIYQQPSYAVESHSRCDVPLEKALKAKKRNKSNRACERVEVGDKSDAANWLISVEVLASSRRILLPAVKSAFKSVDEDYESITPRGSRIILVIFAMMRMAGSA